MIQVKITRGFHRGEPVSGTFKLIKPFQESPSGSFITVEVPAGSEHTWAKTNAPRVRVSREDFVLLDSEGQVLADHVTVNTDGKGVMETNMNYEQSFVAAETEEEAMNRIEETFLMLDKITDACSKNVVRGLVVSGPPGVGKSFGVEKQLVTANLFRTSNGQDPLFEVVSGGVSSIGLYQKLYYNRSSKQVLVFDDCDGVLFDEECLNLLKAALNSGDKRRINWNKESRVLAAEDIPDSFDFEASIIFLSNVDFEKSIERGSRISSHLEAIMSRCHYLDLEIGSVRDKLLRIKQIVRDGMLNTYHFTKEQEQEVLSFVIDNAEYLREISLRMVKKVADFVKADPKGWLEMAEATCLQREAKFKRLMAKRNEAAKRGLALQEV